MSIHVLMRDELEKEGRKKQARSNKRTCPSSALRVVCDIDLCRCGSRQNGVHCAGCMGHHAGRSLATDIYNGYIMFAFIT